MNNKKLALIFVVLAAIYLLSKLFGANRERSFDPNIIQIDTAAVTSVEVYPAQGAPQFTLRREGAGWKLDNDGKSYTVTNTAITALLSNVANIKADRVVSKNPEKYLDYGLDEQARTKLELKSDGKIIGGIEVGRFNYNQTTRSGISYIKKSDAAEVYSVEGFLSMSLNQAMDNYRNKVVLQTTRNDLTRIAYNAAGSSFEYARQGSNWVDESNQPVDSSAMQSYLNTLGSVSGNQFADADGMVGSEIGRLLIEGNNMAGPTEIEVYASQDTSHQFVIQSSANPEGRFFSDSAGIYRRLVSDFFAVREEN